jgi:hypothetical protein
MKHFSESVDLDADTVVSLFMCQVEGAVSPGVRAFLANAKEILREAWERRHKSGKPYKVVGSSRPRKKSFMFDDDGDQSDVKDNSSDVSLLLRNAESETFIRREAPGSLKRENTLFSHQLKRRETKGSLKRETSFFQRQLKARSKTSSFQRIRSKTSSLKARKASAGSLQSRKASAGSLQLKVRKASAGILKASVGTKTDRRIAPLMKATPSDQTEKAESGQQSAREGEVIALEMSPIQELQRVLERPVESVIVVPSCLRDPKTPEGTQNNSANDTVDVSAHSSRLYPQPLPVLEDGDETDDFSCSSCDEFTVSPRYYLL